MRKLKFRAWNGERFVIPFLVDQYGHVYELVRKAKIGLIKGLCIEQYTGLKDKNGKEIYEGDILYLPQDEDGEPELYGDVVFHDGGFNIRTNGHYDHLEDYTDDWTVVGNVHTNKKLIKEGITMHELPEYRNVMKRFSALQVCMEKAKTHDEYKDNPHAQRAFAIAITNIEQAQLWANKAFHSHNKE